MDVKTFEGFSMKDALASVKREFGRDAVILKTKQKKDEAAGTTFYEITAASSGNNRIEGASQGSGEGLSSDLMREIASIKKEILLLRDDLPNLESIDSLTFTIFELRKMLTEALKARHDSNRQETDVKFIEVETSLELHGIESNYIREILRYLSDSPVPKDLTDDQEKIAKFYQSQAVRWLLKRIKIYQSWRPSGDSVSINAIVGPNGSGKTSCIIKIAAASKKAGLNPVIINFEQTKLAATDQLRVYAKLFDIPFESIDRFSDLERVISSNRSSKLFLIDTPGLNPKNADSIKEFSIARKDTIPIDVHLALSTTEKSSQMERAIKSFCNIGLQSLIFTKLDETFAYGDIFNMSHKWSLPLSYFSTGSSIPGSIERASRERVVERIFSLKR